MDNLGNLIIKDLNKANLEFPDIPYFGTDSSLYQFSPDFRPVKDISRHLVATSSKKNKTNLLVFPSTTGRDIQLLKYYDVSAKECKWTLIEKKFSYMQEFKKNAFNMGLFSKSESVIYHQNYLHKLDATQPFDLAWFDFTGNITYDSLYWLQDTFKFNSNADIFFTFSLGRSPNNTLFNIVKKSLKDSEMVEALDLNSLLKELRKKMVIENPISRSISMDHNILIQWLLLQYIFNWQTFTCKCYIYDDKSEMLLYHLHNFKPAEQEFAGTEGIDKLLIISEELRFDDEVIANNVELPPELITRWRAVNKIPGKSKIPEYQMSESFMALLNEADLTPIKVSKAPNILYQQLLLFNPMIEENQQIKITKDETSIKIATPRGRYVLDVKDQIKFDFNGAVRKFTLHPLFLHPYNIEALHSIFRIVFIADEYLHPQLCGYSYKDCIILSQPQQDALQAWVYSFATQEKSGAIVLPTGVGKTLVAARIADMWSSCEPQERKTCRILFLAHQRELLDQAVISFLKQTNFTLDSIGLLYQPLNTVLRKHSVSKSTEDHLSSMVVFSSVQSLSSEEILMSLPPDHFSMIIVDEFHHYKAPEWMPVVEHFSTGSQYLLGLTATPFRGDILDPMELFEKNYLYRMDVAKAIWGGYLVMPIWHIFNDNTDYTEVMRKTKLSKAKVKKLFSKERIRAVLDVYADNAADKQTVAFCNSIAHAKQMADAFNNPKSVGSQVKKIKADYLTSKAPAEHRRQVLLSFYNKEIQIICVVGLFDEGIDVPNVEALLMLRKTDSPVKIFQRLGRGLRLYPGKRNVHILDFVSNYYDRESVLNLGNFTNINKNKLRNFECQLTDELSDPSEARRNRASLSESFDFPILPQLNIKFGAGVEFIIRNVTNRAVSELNALNRQRAIMLRKKYNKLASEIAKSLKVSLVKVMGWLSNIPIKTNTKILLASIRELIDFGLDKEEIYTALKNHIGSYSFDELYDEASKS